MTLRLPHRTHSDEPKRNSALIGIPPLRWKEAFSSNAGSTAREAYEGLLTLSARYPNAHAFQAFCIYITWQQVTEETIAHHFKTGMKLSEAFLASSAGKDQRDINYVTELLESFRAGLGLDEEDEIQVEFRRDTPKGGD